jgi:hypothetical protein
VGALLRATADPAGNQRAAVRGLVERCEPTEVLELLARLGVMTRLGRLLLDDPELDVPHELGDPLRQERVVARGHGLLHHGLTLRLSRALDERGIASVPLKGATLADSVYGDLGARQSSDIDLLVNVPDLDGAVAVATGEGWREVTRSSDGLPRLHRELVHDSAPPLELHWRVHWYEESFAPAALARSEMTPEGWRRMKPADELACLLLFLARDGLAGLRQTTDVLAWWAALGRPESTGAGVAELARAHPELAPALIAAASHAEDMGGLTRGSLVSTTSSLSRRQRVALRLANPWLAGSRPQIAADVSLVDLLLSPRGGFRPFVRRQLLPPEDPPRERYAHAARVVARYAFSAKAAFARPNAR